MLFAPGGIAFRWPMGYPLVLAIGCLFFSFPFISLAQVEERRAVEEDALEEGVRLATKRVNAAFNSGKADEIAAMFLPQGELVDEEGTVYQGRESIEELLTAFFEAFPGAQSEMAIDVIRPISPQLVMEEGRRTVTGGNEGGTAHHRYLAVRVLADGDWKFASLREFADDPPLTPRDHLEPLGWLVGEWISEGRDAPVKVTFRWSDDNQFLLGEYAIGPETGHALKTTQRIGWDAVAGRVRSWMFDSDGGISEGNWTFMDDSWVIKSVTALPDGLSGSATITITPLGPQRFRMRGTDRIVGGRIVEDFDVEVTRPPPSAAP